MVRILIAVVCLLALRLPALGQDSDAEQARRIGGLIERIGNNLPGYNGGLAPTVTLETGRGFSHTTISNLQRARRDARIAAGKGKWSSSLQDELGHIATDMKAAGFGDSTIGATLEQTYGMLDKLGVSYTRVSF